MPTPESVAPAQQAPAHEAPSQEASAPQGGAQWEETAAIARDLIRTDTTNYGEGKARGEAEAAEYVAEHLRALDLEPVLLESAPRRVSVVARVAGADPSKPALVVHGHLDVVPAEAADWSVDPFAGEIRDGMLWGRGAVDMKDMDAMILSSLRDIITNGRRPGRDLIVAFFADEEDGGKLGARYAVDEHPELFAGATEAISEVGGYSIDVEGTRAYLLQTGEKALIWATLIAHGPAAHGSRHVTDNAVTRLARAVAAIGEHAWPIHLTETTRTLIGELARLLGVKPRKIDPETIALRTGSAGGFITATLRTTTNPTMLQAGYKHNVIPGRAEARIDIRPLPGEEDAVLAEVRKLAGDGIEVRIQHRDIGMQAPLAGALPTAIVDSLRRADPGVPVLPYLMPGGTDNKSLHRLGIHGYGFVPLRLPADLDFAGLFHGVDERVPLAALRFGRAVLGDLLTRY